MLRIERINMESIKIQGKRKLNQRATLLLLQKIEELRTAPAATLEPGEHNEEHGSLFVKWNILKDTPYSSVWQFHVTIYHAASKTAIVDGIFYRREEN
ncbi:hypothetical protein L0156_20275 [bacterium]|nr:hypothetical protein [bacterium]